MKVIEGGFKNNAVPATELGARLREIADMIDSGEIQDFVAAYTIEGQPLMTMYGSMMGAIALASLLQSETLEQSKN